ncbi:polysaccharide deacetylase family protein [Clostridium polynesiense]|uniref:polysaccharide deacetylase family protein n=1 Tax=Clostridium polynesiense TaxID=1325933 RepID=UPI000AD25AEF|nr:polysaccharide deacetylase family protein [Clostridium polynesiense]
MNKNIYNKIVVSLFLILGVCIFSVLLSNKNVKTFVINKRLPIYAVNSEKKDIALTFDVNWADKDHLDEILDILKNKEIKATFFVMGGWIEYNKDNVRKLKRIHEEGHEIGNHSNMHPDMTKISKDRMIKEIRLTDDIINKYLGIQTDLFRCPSGAYNNNVIETVEQTKHYCIQWNIDSVDWKEQGEQVEYDRVMKKVKPGSIVLFHNDAKYTPNNLIKIIDNLKGKEYNFVTISQLIYKENYYIDNEGIQHKN